MQVGHSRAFRAAALLMRGTSIASGICFAGAAFAQESPPVPAASAPAATPAPVADASPPAGLTEIVVTAQRREQRLQDVPIAVTAITQDALQANRVINVNDLSGLAPNLTARQSAGSIGIPSFSMRGITSYGVVPGSDKEISVYVDGVYIGSPRGSIFDLPDIARVEVLRGPQGTLFGRNATAGAISITTRDPSGKLGARQEFSVGNYGQFRSRTSIDTPSFGPFSAYVTYLHDQRDGDIRNAGAGTTWNRVGTRNAQGLQVSPRRLGDKDANSVFAALRFDPGGDVTATYKFDYATDNFTPEGVTVIAASRALAPLLTTSPIILTPDAKRPKVVNNSFSTEGYSKIYGHSLTVDARLSDDFSVKNIVAYRRSYIRANTQLDGLGGVNLGTSRFVGIVGQNEAIDRQFSEELQFNYNSKLLTVTVGGLYFWQRGRSGGPLDFPNTISFGLFPGGVINPGPYTSLTGARTGKSISYNKGESMALYAQAELHVTSQLDLVAGGRYTRDEKSGRFEFGGTYVPDATGTNGQVVNAVVSPFRFEDSQPAYSFGVNYKPTEDILLFGKYSRAFVSGGSVGGVDFIPEIAKSWEAGIKADLLNRRLRANLALFTAKYENIQSAQSGINVGRPDLGTVIIPLGDGRAKGFELELTAAPVRHLALSASVGYTDIKYRNVNPILTGPGLANGAYLPTLIPKWTTTLSGQYETEPVVGDANLLFRVDANWRDKMRSQYAGQVALLPGAGVLEFIPSAWIVNGRIALQGFKIGRLSTEVAAWGRNLTNNRAPTFPLNFGNIVLSSTFQRARTYGGDFIVKF